LQIDDEGKVTAEITDRRKLAHVPVQTWRRLGPQWPGRRMILCLGQIQSPDKGNGPSSGSLLNTTA
jgi:hypothetical protein